MEVKLARVLMLALISGLALKAQTCASFSISPSSQSFTNQAGTGVITIATSPATCTSTRTATTSTSWLAITSGATGTGAGTVQYTVQANAGVIDRSAAITVAGQTFNVLQQATPCTFSLDHSSSGFPANGGNDQIQIGASPSGCATARAVSSSVDWITISFGATGTGAGSTGYTVTANNFLTSRSGTINVAGLPFTVTQAPGSCSLSSSGSTSAAVPAVGGSGSFSFTSTNSQCGWSVGGGADWLTITSAASGAGGGRVEFTAAQNAAATSRSAIVTVGALNFTVNQSAGCSIAVTASSLTIPAAGGTGTLTVTGGSGCSWIASSNNPDFLTLTGATTGTANGTVPYAFAANTTGIDRVGSINVNSAGVSILQPSNCNYAITPGSVSLASTGGTGTFTLTASCPWAAASSAPDWLTVSPASGTGNLILSYVSAPNPNVNLRSASITVGSQSFAVQVAGVPCTVSANPAKVDFPASGGSANIAIGASDGCAWAAAASAKWLTVSGPASQGGASGNGAGQLVVTADANSDPTTRTGTVTVANQVISIVQEARQCDYQLSPPGALFGSSGGSGIVSIATSCSWAASSNAPWLVVLNGSGKGNADIHYSVSRLLSSDTRTAALTIGTQSFTVTQSSSACSLTLSETAIGIPMREGRGVLRVTGNSDCHWRPSVDSDGDGWLSIASWANVNGGGLVVYRYEENASVSPRTATIRLTSAGLDPLLAVLTQDGAMPVISDNGVVNAASRRFGPVSPGEIILIRGQGLGPEQPVDQKLSDDAKTVLNVLADVQVLFDGNPAALLRVSSGEVRAVIPYGIAGQSSTQLTVLNQGAASNAVTLDVVAAAPAVFTVGGTGTGQMEALNPNGSTNSPTNAVARNAVVTFFVTGEGQTIPAGVDGLLNGQPGPGPILPVTVQIGGQNAVVVTAGGSPGEVAGRMRIDARVAQQVVPGAAVAVVVRIGSAQTQSGATIAVR